MGSLSLPPLILMMDVTMTPDHYKRTTQCTNGSLTHRVVLVCPLKEDAPRLVLFAACVGATIPVLTEHPLSACGCKKFFIDALGDHVSTCTVHSGVKKTHDWSVDQLADLLHTTHKVKTQQVDRNRGQRCGDIELSGYLSNVSGSVTLVMDLHITHQRWGSRSDPSINGHLHYPNDIHRSLNETTDDKIRKYLVDYYLPPLSCLITTQIESGQHSR